LHNVAHRRCIALFFRAVITLSFKPANPYTARGCPKRLNTLAKVFNTLAKVLNTLAKYRDEDQERYYRPKEQGYTPAVGYIVQPSIPNLFFSNANKITILQAVKVGVIHFQRQVIVLLIGAEGLTD
jgi:hypothetical protein